ncbi:MAG: hypothetical protein KKG78_15385 [Alphaproteobacteria bacterium]|nr:hypothetical protein [Alphaproteobacteria bacterium]
MAGVDLGQSRAEFAIGHMHVQTTCPAHSTSLPKSWKQSSSLREEIFLRRQASLLVDAYQDRRGPALLKTSSRKASHECSPAAWKDFNDG